jgi:hypothetical protein
MANTSSYQRGLDYFQQWGSGRQNPEDNTFTAKVAGLRTYKTG